MDHRSDEAAFREDLKQIASTTPSSKLLTYEKNLFAELAVEAALRIKEHLNLEHIQIIKKPGGSMRDSYLDEARGVVWAC
jgi:T-complex protein 1 subunit beta